MSSDNYVLPPSKPPRNEHVSTNRGRYIAVLDRPLTEKQALYMKHYFECDGKDELIHKACGFKDLPGTIHLGKTKRIQIEIARAIRDKKLMVRKGPTFTLTNEDRIELLWGIAQGGAERIVDKEGNMVFMNAGVSVSAIRAINEMIPGSIAPKEVEVTHKVDNRSEEEIRANVRKLTEEYNRLTSIDGETELVSEQEVLETRELPEVTTEGKITGEKIIYD